MDRHASTLRQLWLAALADVSASDCKAVLFRIGQTRRTDDFLNLRTCLVQPHLAGARTRRGAGAPGGAGQRPGSRWHGVRPCAGPQRRALTPSGCDPRCTRPLPCKRSSPSRFLSSRHHACRSASARACGSGNGPPRRWCAPTRRAGRCGQQLASVGQRDARQPKECRVRRARGGLSEPWLHGRSSRCAGEPAAEGGFTAGAARGQRSTLVVVAGAGREGAGRLCLADRAVHDRRLAQVGGPSGVSVPL